MATRQVLFIQGAGDMRAPDGSGVHYDSQVPFEHLARYAELLPDAEVRELPGDRHPFLDGLTELVEDVTAVLRGDA